MNVSNYSLVISFTESLQKISKMIGLVHSLSRRPLNVARGTSFYASLPILNGEKVLLLWF